MKVVAVVGCLAFVFAVGLPKAVAGGRLALAAAASEATIGEPGPGHATVQQQAPTTTVRSTSQSTVSAVYCGSSGLVVSGRGAAAGSQVTVRIEYNTFDIDNATLTVRSNGRFSGLRKPPAAASTAKVVVSGVEKGGKPFEYVFPRVSVETCALPVQAPPLPATGADPSSLAVLGVGAGAVGCGLVILSRRRRVAPGV